LFLHKRFINYHINSRARAFRGHVFDETTTENIVSEGKFFV